MAIDIKQAERILQSLEQQGISCSYLERALELPFGTAQRWKDGNVSPEEMTLLKIIITYPWIIEVGDNNYKDNIANAAVVEAASKIICSKLLK